MEASKVDPVENLPTGLDALTEEEYSSQSKLLQDFTSISNIDKAWTFKSSPGKGSQAMFLVSQPDLMANKRRKFMLSARISKESSDSVDFQWTPFPVEMMGVSTTVPSPSGTKFLVIRNPGNDSPCKIEIWGPAQVENEFHIPQFVHGSVYIDGWFAGISWNSDETHIAYVAEEPSPTKPTFCNSGYLKSGSTDKDFRSWKAQGDWDEEWGDTYARRRKPALFVIDVDRGEVKAVKGIDKSLSVGQVIWGPSRKGLDQHLIFAGASFSTRKLGIKNFYNRPCGLYAVKAPSYESETDNGDSEDKSAVKNSPVISLTQSISSSYSPRFSPDGKFLVFLSSQTCVDSGAHSATNSLHRIEWPTDGKLSSSLNIANVIPVVMSTEDGQFPGLYCYGIHNNPWLSDGYTMILSSIWGSRHVILSVNLLSGEVMRISPSDSDFSWIILALDVDNIVSVSSSPVDVRQVKYGSLVDKSSWSWSDVSSPIFKVSEKVKSMLSTSQFKVLKIPVNDASDHITEGAKKPFEAIFVYSNKKKSDACDPLIVILHGGPHSTFTTSYFKSHAYFSSIGFNLLLVNYRGSLGFGEEALQSLPGKIGTQDVNDVLTAVDHVVSMGLADPKKIAVLGGSHGGFLATHLIGQAPERFYAAVAKSPVCNLALMVGTTVIPEWCYFETYGVHAKTRFTEAPSEEHLIAFLKKSPISYVSKVKTPTLILVGAQDLCVPVSNGLQYARALKEIGGEVKVNLFPDDAHGIDGPRSDFECYLNIGVWFKKYCKR